MHGSGGGETLSALAAEEEAWLQQLRDEIATAGVAGTSESLSDYFDAQRLKWQWNSTAVDANRVINQVGVGLGDILVAGLDLQWCVYTDAQGSDLAVVGSRDDFTLFPVSSVAKRWLDGEREWIPAFVDWAASNRR